MRCPECQERDDQYGRVLHALLGVQNTLAVLLVLVGFCVAMIILCLCMVASADAYDIQLTFDGSNTTDAFIVNVESTGQVTRTLVVGGGNPYSTTTVTVQALEAGQLSEPSNAISIAPLVEDCQQMDLNDDHLVDTTDILTIMDAVVTGRCIPE